MTWLYSEKTPRPISQPNLGKQKTLRLDRSVFIFIYHYMRQRKPTERKTSVLEPSAL